jgi:hypothetical protein
VALARAAESGYKPAPAATATKGRSGGDDNPKTKEPKMKTILAALLAGTFLISLPLRAEEKAGAEKTEKSDSKKKDKAAKGEKKDDKGAAKTGGGW